MYMLGFLICSYGVRAQDAVSITEQTIADIFEQYAAESDENIEYDTFYEDLMF